LRLFSPLADSFPRRTDTFVVGRLLPDDDQTISLVTRQRAHHHRVQDAEYRRIPSDAERKCGDGDEGESGILHQHSRAVAKVLTNLFKPSHAAGVAATLLRLLHAAETF